MLTAFEADAVLMICGGVILAGLGWLFYFGFRWFIRPIPSDNYQSPTIHRNIYKLPH